MKKTILLNGQIVEYELTIKKVKRLNLRIKPNLSVLVSAPADADEARIENFIRAHQNLVLSSLKQFSQEKAIAPISYQNGDKVLLLGRWFLLNIEKADKCDVVVQPDCVVLKVSDPDNLQLKKDTFTAWAQRQIENIIRREFPIIFAKLCDYNLDTPTIKFKSIKTYWGLCSTKDGKYTLTFNKSLIFVPIECIRYIVAHECAHIIQLDHSAKFYSILSTLCPDYNSLKHRLKKYLFVLQSN